MKILLISANFFQAEGSLAKGILKAVPQHEVYFFSFHEFKHRQPELEHLLKNVDVVHWLFNVAHLPGKYLHYFLESKVPQVATVHHICKEEMEKLKVAEHANLVHVVSSEWKDFVSEHSNSASLKASLGINQSDFVGIKTNLFSSGSFRIGMMGFYPGKYNRKRIDVAWDVFKMLKEKGVDFVVVLQGEGWDNFTPELAEHGILFENTQRTSDEDIFKFFERIHVYLCTSDFEGGPLPVLEALECGIPVVSTDVGIARDALSQGGGLLCPKGDVYSLSEALMSLKEDRTLYFKCSSESKVIAKQYYWEQLAKQYTDLYETAIERWESDNATKWCYSTAELEPGKQRKRELSHVELHQAFIFLYANQFQKGLLKTLKAFSKPEISAKRKIDLGKRVLGYLIGMQKN
jgi:glycosyltransferase involved in cell wall biosynthesis